MARQSEERGFQYRKRTVEDVKARANASAGDFDSMFKSKYPVFKVKEGKNMVRILPPTWDDAKHYGFDLWVNYGVGVDNQAYLSLSKMKAERDPLAEALKDAERNGDKDLAKALRPRKRILMWVIDRDDEEAGPQLWSTPFSVDKALAGLSFDEDSREAMFIDDPKEGCDVRFYKEGTGLKTDYPVEKMRIQKPSPLSRDRGLADEWLEYVQQHPLPTVLQFYDYDHINDVYGGQARVETEDETPPARRARGNGEDEGPPPRRQRPDDSDEEDEPEAEAEEKPRRRVSEPEDDEDEPEKHPRSARRSRIADEEDEPEEKPRANIRDRLRASRNRETDEE
jgi:hypothetical protein